MRVPIPKQHGAWGMLYVPYLSAVFCFGTFDANAILALLVLTVGFFIQEPLLAFIRICPIRKSNPNRFFFLLRWIALYSVTGLILLFGLMHFVWRPLIVPFGFAAALMLLLHFRSISQKLDRKISGELISVFGLTMSAPFTWYILTGRVDRFACLLWVLNTLFFASSIFYVKTRVEWLSKKKNQGRVRLYSTIYHFAVLIFLVTAALMRVLPFVVSLAFLPVLIRAFWGSLTRHPKLNLRNVGLAEFGFSLFFLFFVSYALQ
jgi:hypothetical protein